MNPGFLCFTLASLLQTLLEIMAALQEQSYLVLRRRLPKIFSVYEFSFFSYSIQMIKLPVEKRLRVCDLWLRRNWPALLMQHREGSSSHNYFFPGEGQWTSKDQMIYNTLKGKEQYIFKNQNRFLLFKTFLILIFLTPKAILYWDIAN